MVSANNRLTEALLAQANAHLREGHPEKALPIFRKLLKAAPNQPGLLHLAGVTAARTGALRDARLWLEKSVRLHPNLAVAHGDLGNVYFELGLTKRAVQSFRHALSLDPDLEHVRMNLGRTYSKLVRYEEAEQAFRRIVGTAPKHADAWLSLGNVLYEKGETANAVRAYQSAVERRPTDAGTHYNLANALKDLGRNAAAETAYRAALAIAPGMASCWYNYGNLLLAQERWDEAAAANDRVLAITPHDKDAGANLGLALIRQGRPEQAATVLARIIDQHPDAWQALLHLGMAQKEIGDIAASEATYRRLLGTSPAHADAWNNLGALLSRQGKEWDAVECYDAALKNRPDFPEACNNMGLSLANLGRIDEARCFYRRAIELRPTYAEAYRHLAIASRYKVEDAFLDPLKALAASPDLPDDKRAHALFALAKVQEDLGDWDSAFSALKQGNDLKRREIDYDIEDTHRHFERLKTRFTREFVGRYALPPAEAGPTPIFVVGMPRSGTTLVEQILASHPLIHGAGELDDLFDLSAAQWGPVRSKPFTDALISSADVGTFDSVARDYRRRLRKRAGDAPYATDKLPANFELIGLIRILFPDARIMHCRRNAVETCLSIYKQYFFANLPYAYDLQELGLYYREYESLMTHWRSVLQGSDCFHEIAYETLISNQEEASRALIDACGLDWDPACLNFHENDRTVATASFAQVRQPIYSTSLSVSQRYGDHLAPLLSALDKHTVH